VQLGKLHQLGIEIITRWSCCWGCCLLLGCSISHSLLICLLLDSLLLGSLIGVLLFLVVVDSPCCSSHDCSSNSHPCNPGYRASYYTSSHHGNYLLYIY
jgi:hypothetical protein